MSFLLDTDTVVGLLRGSEPVIKRVSSTPPEAIAISSLTLAELYYGAHKSRRPEHNTLHVRQLETRIAILDFDAPAAAQFGALRAELERLGDRLDDLDLLIASVALSRALTLVTHNTSHFGRVPGLATQDWFEG